MGMEWIVAAVVLVIGIVAAVGLGLGMRDPSTRPYKPGINGLLGIGRRLFRPRFGDERDAAKDADSGDRAGSGKS
jgi:hypothetical protein